MALCAVTSSASAERARWVPVVLETSAPPPSLDALAKLGEALAARDSAELIEPDEAAAQYRQTQSQAPASIQDDVARRLAQQLRAAIAQASMHDWQQAKQFEAEFSALQPAEQDDFLVRAGLSRDVFGLCVMTAMPLIDAARRGEAIERAKTCLQRFPVPGVQRQQFSERTRVVLSEAQRQLHEQGTANLQIEIADSGTCTAFVNGSPWPHAAEPAELPAVGIRVQARCESSGRVHLIALKPGDNHLRIDLRRDRAILAEEHLSLRYASREDARQFRRSDAATIARELRTSAALLAEPTQSGDWVLWLVDPAGDPVDTHALVLSADPSEAELLAVVDRLGRRPLPRPSREQPVAESLSAARGLHEPSDGGFAPSVADIGAVVVGLAGLAGLVASWTYYDLRRQYRDAVASGDSSYQPEYIAQGKNAMLLNVSGAVLLSASAAVLLPGHADAPAVPWVAGGLGLAAVGAGSYLSATGEACSRRQCPAGNPDSLLGPMVLIQSIPLLSVPVTYAIRALISPGSNLEFAVNPSYGGATARLSGSF